MINKIEKCIKKMPFENRVIYLSQNFHYLFQHNHLYQPKLLHEIYRLRESHDRYSNVINEFNKYVDNSIIEAKEKISYLINFQVIV